MRRFLALWLALLAAAGRARAADPALLTADEAVRLALAHSPDTARAAAAVEAARGRLAEDRGPAANPSVAVAASALDPFTSVEVEQELSLGAEARRAREADGAEAEAAAARARLARLAVAARARRTWARAVLATEQAELSRELLAMARRLREAVERRVAAGDATELDLHLARLAEAEAAATWARDARTRDAARLELLAMTGRDRASLPEDPFLAAPDPAGPPAELAALRAASASRRAAEARLAQARAAARPRLGLGAFAEDDGGSLRAGPRLRLDVPAWSRNQGATAASRGSLAVAERDLEQVRTRATAARELAEARDRDAASLADLARPAMLAEAAEAMEAIERAYAAGQVDLATALALRRRVVDGQRAALDLARSIIDDRIDLLLATEDPALLAPSGS